VAFCRPSEKSHYCPYVCRIVNEMCHVESCLSERGYGGMMNSFIPAFEKESAPLLVPSFAGCLPCRDDGLRACVAVCLFVYLFVW